MRILLLALLLLPAAAAADVTNSVSTNATRVVQNWVYKASLTYDGTAWRFDVYNVRKSASEADEQKARGVRRTQVFTGSTVGDLQAMISKFLLWDHNAQTNRVEEFDKAMGKLNNVEQTFYWNGTNSYWLPSELNATEAQMYYKLLFQAPSLRWSLADRNADLEAEEVRKKALREKASAPSK